MFAFAQSKFIADLGFGYPDQINVRTGYQYKRVLGYVGYGKFENQFSNIEQVSAGVRFNFMEYQNMFVSLQNYWTTELVLTHLADSDKNLNAQILRYTATLLRANVGYLFEISERFNFHIYAGMCYGLTKKQKNHPQYYPFGVSAGFSLQYEIFESIKW